MRKTRTEARTLKKTAWAYLERSHGVKLSTSSGRAVVRMKQWQVLRTSVTSHAKTARGQGSGEGCER